MEAEIDAKRENISKATSAFSLACSIVSPTTGAGTSGRRTGAAGQANSANGDREQVAYPLAATTSSLS